MTVPIKKILKWFVVALVALLFLYFAFFLSVWLFNILKNEVSNSFYAQKWEDITMPTQGHLKGIWGANEKDLFFVGDGGLVVHYQDSTAEILESKTDLDLYDAWGCSERDVWLVGGGQWNGSSFQREDESVILHWDGSSLSRVSSPFENLQKLMQIDGHSCDDIWAGGDLSSKKSLLHWDGKSWTEVSVAEEMQGSLTGLNVSSHGEVYYADTDMIAKGNANTWQILKRSSDNANKTLTTFSGLIDGIQVFPDDQLIAWWGNPLRINGQVELWKQDHWASTSCPVRGVAALDLAWGMNSNAIWFFTDNAQVFRLTNQEDCEFDGRLPMTVKAVWGNQNEIWVAGTHGKVKRRKL